MMRGLENIVPQRTFLRTRLVHLTRRISAIGIDSETKQQQRADYLKVEAILVIVDEVHDERHTKTGEACIDNVTDSSTDARGKPIPAPFVQRALHTQYAHRPHWCRCNHPDEHALEDEI